MKLIRLVALAAVLLVPPVASAQDDGFAAFIERGMELWHVPGAAAAVVTDEAVVFRQGFGTTSIRGWPSRR